MHDHKGRPLIIVTLESVERREAEIERLCRLLPLTNARTGILLSKDTGA